MKRMGRVRSKTKKRASQQEHEALFRQALSAFWLRVAFEVKGRLQPAAKPAAKKAARTPRSPGLPPERRSSL